MALTQQEKTARWRAHDPEGFAASRARRNAKRRKHPVDRTVGYIAYHMRVYAARGRAAEQTCACGEPAHDWANLTGNYKDVDDYEAMCRSCHCLFDRGRHYR